MSSRLCCCFVFFLLLLSSIHVLRAQQSYLNNHQFACYNGSFNYTTKGYVCNGLQSSCQSYLTFRSTAIYDSAATISYLLGVQRSAPLIASINNFSSDVARIPPDTLVIIPVNCSCNGGKYYQYNASYTLKDTTETYLSVANLTYQGLSTCQALMDQNPYESHNLQVGYDILVPLRCACPTPNQTADGFNYLLTYMVTLGNTLNYIAHLFNVDTVQRLFYGNNLTSDLIYPFTPILVPLKSEPTLIAVSPPPPPAAQSPQTPTVSVDNSNSSNKWVFVGVGIGAALLILVALSGLSFWCLRRRRYHEPKPDSSTAQKIVSGSTTDYSAPPESNSWSIGVRNAIESLTVYKFAELEAATGYFMEASRIKGSVYKGCFKGDDAAVKVMKGDVTSEINILKKINHSSVIRLSGFCVHDSNTYLVYEFAENGSLSDWIHLNKVLEGENVKNKLQGFMDPSLKNEYPLDLAFSMAQLAKKCVARDLNARPDMPEILMMLSKILSSSLDWDPSEELGRSNSLRT
ncbi:protein LYK5 [Tripterygium wilfordii]|uniref:Protein LYK5 n=1 Tax=Tripterygium wilfordii TaxID=458696 RepID=A0A7J7DLX1_TRIWF|nr:protein LYK5 [Tripterygium wilfordii]